MMNFSSSLIWYMQAALQRANQNHLLTLAEFIHSHVGAVKGNWYWDNCIAAEVKEDQLPGLIVWYKFAIWERMLLVSPRQIGKILADSSPSVYKKGHRWWSLLQRSCAPANVHNTTAAWCNPQKLRKLKRVGTSDSLVVSRSTVAQRMRACCTAIVACLLYAQDCARLVLSLSSGLLCKILYEIWWSSSTGACRRI